MHFSWYVSQSIAMGEKQMLNKISPSYFFMPVGLATLNILEGHAAKSHASGHSQANCTYLP